MTLAQMSVMKLSEFSLGGAGGSRQITSNLIRPEIASHRVLSDEENRNAETEPDVPDIELYSLIKDSVISCNKHPPFTWAWLYDALGWALSLD